MSPSAHPTPYSKSFNFLELNPVGLYLSLEKEKENCCLHKTREEVSCRSRASRAKEVNKKMRDARVKVFANLSLLLFCRPRCRLRLRC